MGTSRSQRSPATPEWERVKELYRAHAPDPRSIISRIVNALDPPTRAGLADAAVGCCLEHLLGCSYNAAAGDDVPLSAVPLPFGQVPVLGLAASLRAGADREIAQLGISSRFGDIAIDALGASVIDVASGSNAVDPLELGSAELRDRLSSHCSQRRLHTLTGTFLGHEMERAFRYFVSRDIQPFIGTEALPDVGAGVALRDAVGQTCREGACAVDIGDTEAATLAALGNPDANQRRSGVLGVLGTATDRVLQTFAEAE